MNNEVQIKERDKITDFENKYQKNLNIFELKDSDARRSYLMGLWDMVPKWVQEQPNYISGKFLEPINRRFSYSGLDFNLDILPAKIKVNENEYKDYFPSRKEEFIEYAIRRLSFKKDQRSILSHKTDETRKDLYAGFFALNELREELKSMKHSYTIDEIKEGLDICARTILVLKSVDGKLKMTSSIFPSVGLKEKDNDENTMCFVQFHPLVAQSINDKSSRLFEYKIYMECKHYISRYLHKRLSNVFTQSSNQDVYNILLSTLLRDAGVSNTWKISDNINMIEDSLKELVSVGILHQNKDQSNYRVDDFKNIRELKIGKALKEGYVLRQRMKNDSILGFQTFVKKQKNKITEAKFLLYPSSRFTSEIIRANQYARCHEYNLTPYDN